MIHDLGDDIHAVLKIEVDEIRLAVLQFVNGGLFLGGASDVGELVVVVDGSNQKWLFGGVRFVGVIEAQLAGIFLPILIDLLLDASLSLLEFFGSLARASTASCL